MKYTLLLATILILVLTACDDGTTDKNSTTLRIQNESSVEITDVIWNNTLFASNQSGSSIKTGTNVTRDVESGTGFIFFKRKDNPIAVRSVDVVVVERPRRVHDADAAGVRGVTRPRR